MRAPGGGWPPAARLATGAAAGALLGVAIGWASNAAMVEISINAVFSVYFGLFFAALAAVIAWRVASFSAGAHRVPLLALSAVVGLAGILCLLYQRHWFFSLPAAARVPLYALLGVAIAFALAFAVAELLNFLASAGAPANPGVVAAGRAQAALVQTPAQVALLACAAVVLGLAYGIMFGSAEIGRGVFTLHTLRTQFIHEERLALPVGAAIGAVTGFLNERWREGGGNNAGDVSRRGGGENDDGAADGLGGFGSENSDQVPSTGASGAAPGRVVEHEIDSSADSSGLFDPFRETSGLTGRRV